MTTPAFTRMERDRAVSSATRVAQRVLLVVGAVAVCAWALYRLQVVVYLLLLSVFFAYLVAPLVEFAERPIRVGRTARRLPRSLAIAVVYVALLAATAAGAAILLPRVTRQIGEAAAQLPAYGASLRGWEQHWARYYERTRLPAEIRESIDRSVQDAGAAGIEYVRQSMVALAGSLAYLPWLVLVPGLAFFLLRDVESVRRMALKSLPHRLQLRWHRLVEELNATFATYIRMQFLACALVGGVCWIGLWALGMPYPALLGALAAVMEFVPLLGPLLFAAACSAVALLQAPMLAVWVCGFLAAVRLVEDYVVYPRLVGRGLHLHPGAVIVGVVAGLELGGLPGIFMAVPVIALVSVGVRHWIEWREADAADSDQS